jgi:hypothetical protein
MNVQKLIIIIIIIIIQSTLLLSGPYLRTGQRGPGPGRHIKEKKLRLKYGMWGEKKGCPRERNLREIYTESTMFCLLSVFCVVFAYT